jgi:ribulose-phosphate 3-epimerase
VSSLLERLSQEPHLSVGVLTADLLRLGDELAVLDDAGVGIIHIDVMDGHFCPPLTVGPPFVSALPDRFTKDVHLMISEPLTKIEEYVAAGAGILTFHIEAEGHPYRLLQSLGGRGIIRGVALNPGTPLALVEPLLDELELLLVLAVNPGWSGQTFLPATAQRLHSARELIGARPILIAVDGGITRANVAQVAGLAPDVIVTGSAVFDGGDTIANVRTMQAALTAAQGPPIASPGRA